MGEGEELMNTKEVLERLGISRASLYNLMKAGKIEPVRNPVLKRPPLQFRRTDVERLLGSR